MIKTQLPRSIKQTKREEAVGSVVTDRKRKEMEEIRGITKQKQELKEKKNMSIKVKKSRKKSQLKSTL